MTSKLKESLERFIEKLNVCEEHKPLLRDAFYAGVACGQAVVGAYMEAADEQALDALFDEIENEINALCERHDFAVSHSVN